MNVLIFGSNGNIGTQLTKKFVAEKKVKKIYLVDIGKNSKIGSKKIKYYKFRNLNNLIIKDKIDISIFASFIMNSKKLNQKKYLIENEKILEKGIFFLSKNNINNFIYLSSVAVYGDQKKICDEKAIVKPFTNYGKIKLHIEKLIKKKSKVLKLRYLILRLSHIYGPKIKNNFIYLFLQNKNNIIINGDGEQIRNLLHVNDLYNFILKTINFKKNNILNLCNEEFSLNSILKIIGAKVKYKKSIKEPKYQRIIGYKARKLFKWKPVFKLKLNIKNIL